MNEFTAAYVQGFQKGAAETYLSERDKPSGSGNDILPMDTMGGAISDVLLPGSQGGFRAGKGEVMAKSTRQEVPWTVKRPITSTVLSALGGEVAGGAAGALLGAGIGELASDEPGEGAAVGGVIGMGTGAILGYVLAGIRRRKALKGIVSKYDEAEKVQPYARRGGWGGFMAGAHEMGRGEGLAAVTGRPHENPTLNKVNTSLAVVPYLNNATFVTQPMGKHHGRSRIKDIVAQEMGYVPGGFGVTNRMAPNRALAAAN